MYNTFYNYENINLWDDANWKDHYSPFCALSQFIEAKNHELYRTVPGVGPYTGRTDGRYNGKTYSYFYDDYINRWAEKGLFFHSTEQGSVCWTAMVPMAVKEGKVHNPKVLAVLCDVDFSDPNWSVHTLLKYEHYNELAAKEGFVPVYMCSDNVSISNIPISILQEFSVIYNLTMDPLYIDVSTLTKNGIKIADVPGYTYTLRDGTKVDDPDAYIEDFYGIPALDVTGRWQNSISVLMDIRSPWLAHPLFDPDKFIHSAAGREMANALRIEYDYDKGDEPAFVKLWEDKGLDYKTHDYKGFQWLSFAPKAWLGQNEEKLPVVLLFQEVTYQDKHQIVSATAAYRNYLELAATGELIVLFFALESADDNDMFYDILLEAEKEYPIDLSRVYVTGQSHNGYFTDEFVRRHHDKIAACAPLSNHLGIPEADCTTSNVIVPDDKIKLSSTYDMPTIIVTSSAENRNGNLHCREDGKGYNAARAFQRRLEANRCPMKSIEEINAVLESDDYIRRNIMFPVDRTDLQFRDGNECYIGDVKNIDGKYHLRFVVMANQTHFIAPHMPELSWDFLRRFKRDLETGEVIELY